MMGKDTAISWCHHTFNPWHGCEKVSPGCAKCYAEAFSKRNGLDIWGRGKPRRFFSDKHWLEPVHWNDVAGLVGDRRRVFCSSMADVFEDRRDLDPWRERLWDLINETPHLDWLLLTKRPENVLRLHEDWTERENVWIGTSVEDQESADERIPHLLEVPARVRFLSCEPLLGPVDLTRIDMLRALDGYTGHVKGEHDPRCTLNALTGHVAGPDDILPDKIGWVIAGGESGLGSRPCDLAWIRSLVEQCRDASVPVFVKQDSGWKPGQQGRVPDDLWIKEVPRG